MDRVGQNVQIHAKKTLLVKAKMSCIAVVRDLAEKNPASQTVSFGPGESFHGLYIGQQSLIFSGSGTVRGQGDRVCIPVTTSCLQPTRALSKGVIMENTIRLNALLALTTQHASYVQGKDQAAEYLL